MSKFIVITPPDPYNLGNVPNGATTNFDITLHNTGTQPVTVSGGVTTNTDYVNPGPFPQVIPAGGSFVMHSSITPTHLGADNTILAFSADSSNVPLIHVNANSVSVAGGVITIAPAAIVFGTQKIGTHAPTFNLQILNTGTVNFHVTALTVTGDPSFTITPPGLPALIPFGGGIILPVDWFPQLLGLLTGDLEIDTDLAAPQNVVHVSMSGVSVALFAVSILSGALYQFLFGIDDSSNHVLIDGDFNAQWDGILEFNGVLWGAVGQEKTMQRLYVLYENVGVCAGLKATVTVLRPTKGADFYDVVEKTVTIGTVLADGKVRSAFWDLQASGEIAFLKITRPGNSGPLSLVGFVPSFDVKGEKVENV